MPYSIKSVFKIITVELERVAANRFHLTGFSGFLARRVVCSGLYHHNQGATIS